MINMMEKVPTRVNTMTPFTNFWTAKSLHGSAYSLTRGTVKYLSCKQYCNLQDNLHVPSKRVAQVKNSSGPVALSCVDRAKSRYWKRSEQEKQWGKGVRSESRRNSWMVLFNKSSLRILPVYQILVNPMNGLFWQLLSTVYYLMEMRSDSDEIIS